jgi:hypothetical protein
MKNLASTSRRIAPGLPSSGSDLPAGSAFRFVLPLVVATSAHAAGMAAASADASDPGPAPARIEAVSTVISVDAAATVNTFRPADVFGVNLVPYVDRADYAQVAAKQQAAGGVMMRYPSGIANDFHWNGTGRFDAHGWWTPDRSQYSPGFQGFQSHRGTTSHYGRPSLVTDGKPETCWLSLADAAAPEAQWVYVDLGGVKTADAVSILWGTPWATRFTVQYWRPTAANQWAPYAHTADEWTNTTADRVAGDGGFQRVAFQPVASRYFRLLLSASSAKPAQYAIAEFGVLNGTNQLTTNTHTMSLDKADGMWKPDQSWTVASSADPACAKEQTFSFDFESFMAHVRKLSPRASPILTINCGGATPQEAAAWVHYANRVRRYGIKYWEIGNEMNGSWETGGPLSAGEYARRYLAFYDAMKTEDPGIVIAGPGASDAAAVSGDYDGKTYLEAFVDRLALAGRAGCAEAIDFHWYPFFMNDNRRTTWDTVTQMSALPARMDQWFLHHPQRSTVPLWLSEFNSGAGTPFSTSIENGLWLANTLGEYLRAFGSRGLASYWTVLHPANASLNLAGGDQSFFQLEKNAWQYQERPVYWAMWLMAAHWAIPGDASVHRLVRASCDPPRLSVYANLRPDGSLALLVLNRDLVETCRTRLELRGFSPANQARRWTFDASHYAWSTNAPPYHADPDRAPARDELKGIGPVFKHAFPPGSITVLEFTDRSRPGRSGAATRAKP